MWWTKAQDLRELRLSDQILNYCEDSLGPEYRIGDGDPQVDAVMSPGRTQATNAETAEERRQHFEWTRPAGLLVAETFLVTGRARTFSGSESHIWYRPGFPRFNMGRWYGLWMVELLGREGGTLTFGFNTSGEMESFSRLLQAR